MKVLPLISFLLITSAASAQLSFPDRCVGVWSGTMHLYKYGKLTDSVAVQLTVSRIDEQSWTWRTEYLSQKMPMTKDYVLRLKDAAKNLYVTDEGDGLLLTDYLTGNKLYSVFETHDVMLTSSYELQGERLVFEVTSGKKEPQVHAEVNTWSTTNVQRVVLKKLKP